MADPENQDQVDKALTTADLLKLHTVKVIESHMTSTYEESATAISLEAVHKYKQYKDVAFHVKHQMDKKYPSSGKATEGVFHCICGSNFASELACSVLYNDTQQRLTFTVACCSCHQPRDPVLHPFASGHTPYSAVQIQGQPFFSI